MDLSEFPLIMDVHDLIKLGLFKSRQVAGLWRKEGKGPRWRKISQGSIVYYREDVKEWLEQQVA